MISKIDIDNWNNRIQNKILKDAQRHKEKVLANAKVLEKKLQRFLSKNEDYPFEVANPIFITLDEAVHCLCLKYNLKADFYSDKYSIEPCNSEEKPGFRNLFGDTIDFKNLPEL
jgi:hypothetical protein